MAVLHGKGGLIKYKTKTLVNMNAWNLTVDNEIIDVTAFSSAGVNYRAWTPGFGSWNGSVSGFADLADTSGQAVIRTNILTPATGTIKLFLNDSGTQHFYGDVYWRSGTYGASVDAVEPVVFNFQGNGALTYSTTG